MTMEAPCAASVARVQYAAMTPGASLTRGTTTVSSCAWASSSCPGSMVTLTRRACMTSHPFPGQDPSDADFAHFIGTVESGFHTAAFGAEPGTGASAPSAEVQAMLVMAGIHTLETDE